ncbi:MAG: hypothetical protein ACRDIB_09940, partial [Ardenticatenaceae bacterium]
LYHRLGSKMEIRDREWAPPDGSDPIAGYELVHETARIIVLPSYGGKIASLVHLPSEKEWLWLNPHLRWRPPSRDASFVREHDVGGWDECFPTIAPTTVGGIQWPDHGDLWWRAWKAEVRDGSLWMGVEGEGFRFERVIASSTSGFRLSYAVENLAPEPLPYLWCAHPLLCIDPPLRVEILGRPTMRLGDDGPLGQRGQAYRWPTVGGRLFEMIGKPSGLAAKLFVEMVEGQVSLCDTKGARLRLRWPLRRVPMLGLWINEGGWSGAAVPPYHNVGVEPASGAPDDLAIALRQWDCAQTLPGGERHTWWLEVKLTREDNDSDRR